MPEYIDIPSAGTFKNDSSAVFSSRSSDKTLVQVDNLLARYEGALAGEKQDLLYYLYLSVRYWIKHCGITAQHKAPTGYNGSNNPLPTSKNESSQRRRQSLIDLFMIVRKKLYTIHGVNNEASLVNLLSAIYLVDNNELVNDNLWLTKHPSDDDITVHITDDGIRRRYKLRIRNGLAYRWGAYGDGNCGYVLFDTTDNKESEINDGLCHFAMDKRGRIFVGFNKDIVWFKHSSLLGGDRAQAAGRMRVVNGRIAFFNNDSGHYQPGARQMVNLLQRLSVYGIDLTNIKVQRCFPDNVTFKAIDVYNDLSKWPDE